MQLRSRISSSAGSFISPRRYIYNVAPVKEPRGLALGFVLLVLPVLGPAVGWRRAGNTAVTFLRCLWGKGLDQEFRPEAAAFRFSGWLRIRAITSRISPNVISGGSASLMGVSGENPSLAQTASIIA
jgi:hypothetical protein